MLIINNGKILVCKREKKDNDKFSEMYGLPGGHVRKNESDKDGAIRETKEETNLIVKNPKFVKTYEFDNNQIHLFVKEVKDINNIKLNHEHTDYKLVSPSSLKKPEIVPTIKEMYNDYKNKYLKEDIDRIKHLINYLLS